MTAKTIKELEIEAQRWRDTAQQLAGSKLGDKARRWAKFYENAIALRKAEQQCKKLKLERRIALDEEKE